MKQFVYILSSYAENGANNVRATLVRDRLPGMLSELMQECRPNIDDDESEEQFRLKELLEQTDAILAEDDGNDLSVLWGGFQLHVVELKP
jgi:hypothetical protein